MRIRRLLWVRPGRKRSLAPMYLALWLVAPLGALEFVIDFWLGETAPSVHRPAQAKPANESQSSGSGVRLPPNGTDPRARRIWI
jgi:hypothetical protein